MLLINRFLLNTNWPYDWQGLCDDDNDGIINSNEISGCQDINACNYNSFATDPASCLYIDGICERQFGEIDGTGIVVDNDVVNDNVCNNVDNCLNDANEDQSDNDSDGLGNVCDTDDDNDGALDEVDSNDNNANICSDTDGDSCDDCSSGSYNVSNDGFDYDGDGACDVGDLDDDNDGAPDQFDTEDNNPNICSDVDKNDTCMIVHLVYIRI